jgi:predicted nucleotidyltransferase
MLLNILKNKQITAMVKREIINIINQLIDRLSQEGIYINYTYLYGSYAKGLQSMDSDIDVMLVSDIFDNDDDKTIGKVWRISKSIDLRIEPYTIGLNKFKTNDTSPLLQIIRTEGVPLFYPTL